MQRYNNITNKNSLRLLNSLHSQEGSIAYYDKYHKLVSYGSALYTQTSRLRSFLKNDITFEHDLKQHPVLLKRGEDGIFSLPEDERSVKIQEVKSAYNRLQYVYSYINSYINELQSLREKDSEQLAHIVDRLWEAARVYCQILWEISSTSIVSEIYGHYTKDAVISFLLTFGWNEFLRIIEP